MFKKPAPAPVAAPLTAKSGQDPVAASLTWMQTQLKPAVDAHAYLGTPAANDALRAVMYPTEGTRPPQPTEPTEPTEPPPSSLPPRTLTEYSGSGIAISGGGGQGGLDQLVENVELVYVGPASEEHEGISIVGPRAKVTLRNVIVRGFTLNVSVQGNEGDVGELILEDCVLEGAGLGTTFKSQGFYVSRVKKITMRRCLFSHNGASDIFSHNVYLQQDCGPADVRECVFDSGGSHGMQVRSGGTVEDCLFHGNPISLSFGGGTEFVPGGVSAFARRNVFLNGDNITDDLPRGWGIHLCNVKSGELSSNAFLDNLGDDASPIILDPAAVDQHGTASIGVLNVSTDGANLSRDWPKVRSAEKGGPPFVSLDSASPITGTSIEVEDSDATIDPDTAALQALLKPDLPRPSVAAYNATIQQALGITT